MQRPEPTLFILSFALAYFCVFSMGCQHPDPKATPVSASAPQASAAPRPRATAEALSSASAEPAAAVAPAVSSPPPARAPITSVLVLGDSLSDERGGGGGFVK